jgi:hypothetical protein
MTPSTYVDVKSGKECANLTIINLTLRIWGPMSERNLCIALLILQSLCCGIGFGIRYEISKFFFDE